MSNKIYQVNEEVEITLTVKVKLQTISNYSKLSQEDIKNEIEDAKGNLSDFLKGELSKNYYNETLTSGVDWWNFEVIS